MDFISQNKKIVIVPDKFKGSLTAPEVAEAIAKGISKQCQACGKPSPELLLRPMADGGDGSMEVMESALSAAGIPCRKQFAPVLSLLGEPMDAPYLLIGTPGTSGTLATPSVPYTAFIEMAKVCGLSQIPSAARNPLTFTTYGLGQLIRQAAATPSLRKLIISIGGSATNDAGRGLLTALVSPTVSSTITASPSISADGKLSLPLARIPVGNAGGPNVSLTALIYGEAPRSIYGEIPGAAEERKAAFAKRKALRASAEESFSFAKADCGDSDHEIVVEVACDVTNPLLGDNGATYVYGPQKFSPEITGKALEDSLEKLEKRVEEWASSLGLEDWKAEAEYPGAGAAGGVGFALHAVLGAKLIPGWKLFSDLLHLESDISAADLVITGEGRFDAQSIQGKLPSGIAQLCRKHNKPLWLICGQNLLPESQWRPAGITRVTALTDIHPDITFCISHAKQILSSLLL